MGKKSDPPPAPDYAALAEKQGQSSLANTSAQTWANRPTINTPWGSQTWQAGSTTDPSTGKPVTNWTSNIQLSPDQREALDSQMRVQTGRSQGAEALMRNALQGFGVSLPAGGGSSSSGKGSNPPQPGAPGGKNPTSPPQPGGGGNPQQIDYSGAPAMGDRVQPGQFQTSLAGNSGDYRQRAQDAITQLQQPDLDRRRAALNTQLSNQGITRGSEAYDAAMREQNDAETRAHLSAIGEGRNESNMAFNQNLQAGQFGNQGLSAQNSADIAAGGFNNQNRQQYLSELLSRRSQPLNELNALLTGQQVGMPQMPSFNTATKTDPTNYLQAGNMQYQAGMDAYNANQAADASTMGGLFSMGSAALSNPQLMSSLFAFSDERLKQDIKVLFTLPNGVEVCQYRFKGSDYLELGVIAQQVQTVMPDAVKADHRGILKVNYNVVLA